MNTVCSASVSSIPFRSHRLVKMSILRKKKLQIQGVKESDRLMSVPCSRLGSGFIRALRMKRKKETNKKEKQPHLLWHLLGVLLVCRHIQLQPRAMHLKAGISATSAQIRDSIWCELRYHTRNADVRAPSPRFHVKLEHQRPESWFWSPLLWPTDTSAIANWLFDYFSTGETTGSLNWNVSPVFQQVLLPSKVCTGLISVIREPMFFLDSS